MSLTTSGEKLTQLPRAHPQRPAGRVGKVSPSLSALRSPEAWSPQRAWFLNKATYYFELAGLKFPPSAETRPQELS